MLLWRFVLINKGRDLAMMVQEGGLRRDASLAKQSRGQKGQFTIQGNVSGDFVGKDKHY